MYMKRSKGFMKSPFSLPFIAFMIINIIAFILSVMDIISVTTQLLVTVLALGLQFVWNQRILKLRR